MKKYVLLALLCSYGVLFSQGLAFSRIIILPSDVPATQVTYYGNNFDEIAVPQNKVWKIVNFSNSNEFSSDNCEDVLIKSNLTFNTSSSVSYRELCYFIKNDLIESGGMWLGENHSILFEGGFKPINIIEYDVLP